MQMETKYGLGDIIFSIKGEDIMFGVIKMIEYKKSKVSDDIRYTIQWGDNQSVSSTTTLEKNLFSTKVEAAYAWLKNQELDAREVLQGFLAQEKENE